MFGRGDTELLPVQQKHLYSYLNGLKGAKAGARIIAAMSHDAEVVARWLGRDLTHQFLDAAIAYYRGINAVAELSDLAGFSDVSVSNRKSKKKG